MLSNGSEFCIFFAYQPTWLLIAHVEWQLMRAALEKLFVFAFHAFLLGTLFRFGRSLLLQSQPNHVKRVSAGDRTQKKNGKKCTQIWLPELKMKMKCLSVVGR